MENKQQKTYQELSRSFSHPSIPLRRRRCHGSVMTHALDFTCMCRSIRHNGFAFMYEIKNLHGALQDLNLKDQSFSSIGLVVLILPTCEIIPSLV